MLEVVGDLVVSASAHGTVATAAAGTTGDGLVVPQLLGLVLAGGLGARMMVQVRRARAVNGELEAAARATDARARALAQRMGSGRLQRNEARPEDVDED